MVSICSGSGRTYQRQWQRAAALIANDGLRGGYDNWDKITIIYILAAVAAAAAKKMAATSEQTAAAGKMTAAATAEDQATLLQCISGGSSIGSCGGICGVIRRWAANLRQRHKFWRWAVAANLPFVRAGGVVRHCPCGLRCRLAAAVASAAVAVSYA